jgi:hypothetical protein
MLLNGLGQVLGVWPLGPGMLRNLERLIWIAGPFRGRKQGAADTLMPWWTFVSDYESVGLWFDSLWPHHFLRRSCAIVVSFRSALIVTIALEGCCPRLFYMSWWSLCSMDHPSAGRELTSIYRSDFAAINGPVSRDRAQQPVWGLSRLVSDWTPSLVCPTVASFHLGHVTMVPWAPALR